MAVGPEALGESMGLAMQQYLLDVRVEETIKEAITQAVADKADEAGPLLVCLRACAKKASKDEALKAGSDALAKAKDKKTEGKAHLGIAAAHMVAGDMDAGRTAADAGLAAFREAGDKKLEVVALLMLADVYLMKEWPRQAYTVADVALVISRDLKYTTGEGIALNSLVRGLTGRGDSKDALKIAEDALARAVEDEAALSARSAMVHVLMDRNEPTAALEHAQEEMKLQTDKRRKANLQLTVSLMQGQVGAGADAEDIATEAQEAFKELDDHKGEGVASYVLTYANIANGNDVEAQRVGEATRAIFQDVGDKRWEAATLLALSSCAQNQEERKEALAHLDAAKALYDEIGDKKGWCAAEMDGAAIYFKAESNDNAMMAANVAVESLRANGHKRAEAAALHFCARVHLANDEVELALEKEAEARKCCRRVDDKKGECVLLQKVTEHYFFKHMKALDAGDAKLARAVFRNVQRSAKDALGRARVDGNKDILGSALVQMARAHLMNRKGDKAKECSQEAMDLLAETNNQGKEAWAMSLHAESIMGSDKEKAQFLGQKAISTAKTAKDPVAEFYAITVYNETFKEQKQAEQNDADAQAKSYEEWMRSQNQGGEQQAESNFAVAETSTPKLDFETVRDIIVKNAKDTVGDDDGLEMDTPLMDAGLDSLSSVAFRNTLQRQIAGVNLPSSLMFDYPTINQIADFIIEESANS